MILDEPTEGIQPSIIMEIEDAIANLTRSGLSILLVEQYMEFALRLADRYLILDAGEVVVVGQDRRPGRGPDAQAGLDMIAVNAS